MGKEEIFLSDWHRILFGDAPVVFLLEVLVRTLFTYLVLLIAVRVMGKRMSGQLTSTEMAVMLLLGAIVSAPMQMPDRGLLQGVLLLFLIMFIQRWLTDRMRKHPALEKSLQGDVSILVMDGELQLKEMDAVKISREQLFAALRTQRIFNLGEVKRLYLESHGEFTTFLQKEAKPGLSILPKKDLPIHDRQNILDMPEKVCERCGRLQEPVRNCRNCGNEEWEKPVL